MGVLCEIGITADWAYEGRSLPNGMEEWSVSHGAQKAVYVPPPTFLSMIKLSFLDVAHLTRMGDGQKASFLHFAAWIEEHL